MPEIISDPDEVAAIKAIRRKGALVEALRDGRVWVVDRLTARPGVMP